MMFIIKHKQEESGQIIILMAFLMIAMIAMLGLAIDGGGLMLLQRDVQNASDAAVVAATYAVCSGGSDAQIIDAARSTAKNQGFEHGVDGVTVNVDPNYSGSTSEVKYVQVVIDAPKDSYFIQIVYTDQLAVSAEGVGRCNVADTSASANGEYALWAGSTTCNNTIDWSGSSTYIEGDIHSNNDIHVGGQTNIVEGQGTLVGSLDAPPDKIDWIPSANNPITPAPMHSNDPLGLDISDYAPGGSKWNQAMSDPNHIAVSYPCNNANDKMDSGWLKDEGYFDDNTKELDDGLYYSACSIDIGVSDLSSDSVTFVAEGEVNFSGSEHYLRPYLDGVLVFSNEKHNGGSQCSNGVVKMAGSTHNWEGIIYAPNGLIEMSGSSNTSMRGSLIGYAIRLNGSSIEIHFDSTYWPPPVAPPTIGIAQ